MCLVLILSGANLFADTFTFSGSGPGVTVSATFDGTPIAVDQYLVTSISGTVNGNPITGLLPGGPGQMISPSGSWFYDNVYYTTNPHFDLAGLGFYINGTTEANLFFQDTAYIQGIGNGPITLYSLTSFDAAPVPEPTSLVLLGSGLIGLGARLRRRSV
jgi:hypothetical protein